MGVKGMSSLEGLSDDLQKVVADTIPAAKKIVGKGSLNIKKEAQRIIRARSKRGYLPHYPRAISYEVEAHGAIVSSEIGPSADRLQGGLGRLLEEGSVNNAPIPHLSPALDGEENVFYGYMEVLGESLLEGRKVDGPEVDPG